MSDQWPYINRKSPYKFSGKSIYLGAAGITRQHAPQLLHNFDPNESEQMMEFKHVKAAKKIMQKEANFMTDVRLSLFPRDSNTPHARRAVLYMSMLTPVEFWDLLAKKYKF